MANSPAAEEVLETDEAGPNSTSFSIKNVGEGVDDAVLTASNSIDQYLEKLTLEVIDGVNSRGFETHPSIAYFSPHWKAQSKDQNILYPLDRHFDIMRELTTDNPKLWIHVVNINTVMGCRHLCADVMVDMEYHGFAPGVVRTCICVFHRKVFDDEDGKKTWLCVRHTGARGVIGIEPLRECGGRIGEGM